MLLHIKRQSNTQGNEMGKQQDHLTKGPKIHILDTNAHVVSFVAMVRYLNLSELLLMNSSTDALSKLNKSYLILHGHGVRINKKRV